MPSLFYNESIEMLGSAHQEGWRSVIKESDWGDGPNKGSAGDWIYHPLIRQYSGGRTGWRMRDQFRACMGLYMSAKTGSDNANHQEFMNMSTNSWWNQRRPLNYSFSEVETSGVDINNVPLGGFEATIGDRILLTYNNAGWNEMRASGTPNGNYGANDLLDYLIQGDGIEGDPFFAYYLRDGFPVDAGDVGNTTPIDPIFNRTSQNSFEWDYYTKFNRPPPAEGALLRDGDYDIKVTPVYQTYYTTDPPYEDIISEIPEYMLPNFYVFETELRNESAQVTCEKYRKMLEMVTPSRPDGYATDAEGNSWFEPTVGGMTESGAGEYFQMLANGYKEILSSPANFNAVDAYYQKKYKNFAVLYKDLNVLDDLLIFDDRDAENQPDQAGNNVSALLHFPFYNKITIGGAEGVADLDIPQGTEFGGNRGSFFDSQTGIMQYYGALDWLTRFQVRAVYQLDHARVRNNGSLYEPPRTWKMQRPVYESGIDEPDTGTVVDEIQTRRSITFPDFVDRTTNNSWLWPSTWRMYQNRNNLLAGGNVAARVTYLRDFSNGPNSEVATSDPGPNGLYNGRGPGKTSRNRMETFNATAHLTNLVNERSRNLQQVWDCKKAWSETLFYVIEKYVVPPQMEVPPAGATPVQTFYISKNFDEPNKAITYIDTQVKYGVKYQYDIKQVRLVFGTKYGYRDVEIYFGPYNGYGRAIGNALGVFREEHNQHAWYDNWFAEMGGGTATSFDTTQGEFGNFDNNQGVDQYLTDTAGFDTGAGAQDTPRIRGDEPARGYFIFSPANGRAPGGGTPPPSGFNFAPFETSYYTNDVTELSNPSSADPLLWENFKLKMQKGYGFGGNHTGGAMAWVYTPQVQADADPCWGMPGFHWDENLQQCIPDEPIEGTGPADDAGQILLEANGLLLLEEASGLADSKQQHEIENIILSDVVADINGWVQDLVQSGGRSILPQHVWDQIDIFNSGVGPFDGPGDPHQLAGMGGVPGELMGFAQGLDTLRQQIFGAGSGMDSGWGNQNQFLNNQMGDNLSSYFGAMSRISQGVPPAGMSDAELLVQGFTPLLTGITDQAAQLAGGMQQSLDANLNLMLESQNTNAQLFNDGLTSMTNTLSTNIGSIGSDLGNILVGDDGIGALVNSINDLGLPFGDLANTLGTGLENLGDDILNLGTTFGDEVLNLGGLLGDDILQGMSGLSGDILTGMSGLSGDILTGMSGNQDAIQGLLASMVDQGGTLTQLVTDLSAQGVADMSALQDMVDAINYGQGMDSLGDTVEGGYDTSDLALGVVDVPVEAIDDVVDDVVDLNMTGGDISISMTMGGGAEIPLDLGILGLLGF